MKKLERNPTECNISVEYKVESFRKVPPDSYQLYDPNPFNF